MNRFLQLAAGVTGSGFFFAAIARCDSAGAFCEKETRPLLLCVQLFAEQQSLIQRLDGATRAKVLAALAGLVILGFAMVLLTWLGGRITRRYMRGPQRFQPAKSLPHDDWAQKQLSSGETSEPNEP